ncbi:MAG: hypothetical protein MUD12_06580 [Spirochaetes bacterium]|nr:hypothetical protein [Spirochaetota bacterium]
MKKIIMAGALIISIAVVLGAQEADKKGGKSEEKSLLSSENLDAQGRSLDKQIAELSAAIENVIKRYDLLNTKGIRIVPYQMDLKQEKDYIELEKHSFIKNDLYKDEILGLRTKTFKIYTNGQTISRIETVIFEKNYYTGDWDMVTIIDPSPTAPGTDDVTFTHVKSGKKVQENKKMSDIKNTLASPIRNEIKRDFIVPTLTTFNNSLLFIAEAYYKSLKDVDGAMSDFLKGSTIN